MVEAAVEADLEAEFLGRCGKGFLDLPDLGGAEVDRLLAENVLSGIDGFNGNRGVRVRGRADQNGIDLGVLEDFMVVGDDFCSGGFHPLSDFGFDVGVCDFCDSGARDA